METKEKMLVESYKFATVRHGIGLYGQRLLLRIVEAVQVELEGLSFKDRKDIRKIDVDTETNLFGEKEFTMPLSAIMKSENLTKEVKDQIEALAFSPVRYEDGEIWKVSPFFAEVEIKKGTRVLRAIMRPMVWEALMDFSKGFCKFSLDKAMSFKSAYSLRFYQIISLKTDPITHSLQSLRKMLGLEKKYKKTQDFIKNTIEVAKEELDSCSPYTFEYEQIFTPSGKAGRPKVTAIRFFPKYQRQFDSEEAEFQDLSAKHPTLSPLSDAQEIRVMKTFGITRKGIRNNHKVFEAAVKHLDFDKLIDKIARRVSIKRPTNPAGYLVRALKDELIGEGIEL